MIFSLKLNLIFLQIYNNKFLFLIIRNNLKKTVLNIAEKILVVFLLEKICNHNACNENKMLTTSNANFLIFPFHD